MHRIQLRDDSIRKNRGKSSGYTQVNHLGAGSVSASGKWKTTASADFRIKIMSNPWLNIPLAGYEGHMRSDKVQQLDALSKLFAAALERCRPPLPY
jgi:hypothetical protein